MIHREARQEGHRQSPRWHQRSLAVLDTGCNSNREIRVILQ